MRVRERALGAVLPDDKVLLRRELLSPLIVGLGDLHAAIGIHILTVILDLVVSSPGTRVCEQ
jgi:hypothetical protein